MTKTPYTKNLLLGALLVALLGALSVDASAAWQDDTMLVGKQADQVVVRKGAAERLDIWKATMYPYVTDVKYTVDVPKLPEALPKFDVTANIEMTLGDGTKKTISHTVTIDIENEFKYEPQTNK